MDGPEDAKEDFLGQVEGLIAVAQQVDRELHHHTLVFGHQLRAGHLVARCTPLHQRRFANADVRPIRGAGLLHKEIPGNLLHYSQVRHPTRGKVPSPSDTMMETMRRVLLLAAVLAVAAGAAFVAYQAIRDRDYQALLARGDAALRSEQNFPAVDAYSGAVALRPDSMLPRLRRGEAYQRRGDLDAAVRDFRDAADLDAAATRPREELGDVLYQLQRYQRAAEAFESALALDDRLTRVEYKLALARYRAGDARGAIAALARTSQGPDATAEMHYLLGLSFRDTDRIADAQRSFEKAIAMSPGLIAAREELADLYSTQTRRADVLDQLQVLAGLDRDRVERQVVVALAQARAGHTEPAIVTLGTALERAPEDPRIYGALGQVWLQDAETRNDRFALNKALEALERAGSGSNVTSETLTLFGRALLRNGQVDRAEQVLQLATTRYPLSPMSFSYYAAAAERQKHFDAARQALIDLAALQGDDDNLAERAATIASLSMRLNDPASAARWFQKAVDAGGPGASDPKLLKSLADAQFKAGLKSPGAAASGR
jgi:tetratricopeptide (TPR) repeat protein